MGLTRSSAVCGHVFVTAGVYRATNIKTAEAANVRSGGDNGGVTILGLTFKENIPDLRNSKVMDIIRELHGFGIPIQAHDPIADPGDAQSEYGIKLLPRHALQPGQAVILAVPHHCFVDEGWLLVTSLLKNAKGAVLDVKAKLPTEYRPAGIDLWRL